MSGWKMAAVFGALALSVSACGSMAGLGTVGDVLGGGTSVYGEVRSVDTRRGRIQVREQHGRDQMVRYDNRTRVTYQNRQYPVSSLERGDQVQMRVEYDRNNTAWADHIEVRASARGSARGGERRDDRDRNGSVRRSRVERLDGRVQGVDMRRGYFTMTQTRGPRMLVYVPRDARREDIRRFERLRRGDRVRAEVRVAGRGDQAELVRFR